MNRKAAKIRPIEFIGTLMGRRWDAVKNQSLTTIRPIVPLSAYFSHVCVCVRARTRTRVKITHFIGTSGTE